MCASLESLSHHHQRFSPHLSGVDLLGFGKILEVSPQKLDSPTQAFDPPSNLSSLPLAPTSVLSPNALEFVPSNPTTAKPTAIKESNISFRGCSMSDTERDNNWSTSKAYDSDFEHLGYGNKQVHLEEESEWETDNGEENEDQDNDSMVKLPLEEEIKTAIWQLNPNSSAGPDGYNGEFFKKFWDTIKEDIISATHEFFLGIPIPKAFGSTYIILIPKMEGAKAIGDFRPIALSTFFSKMLSRIMANRLAPLLNKLFSPEQAGFQKGKGIEEHILLTNELMHKLESKVRGGNVMIKLDMAKAFDKMSWSYIGAVLQGFGFTEKSTSLLLQNLRASRQEVNLRKSKIYCKKNCHGDYRLKVEEALGYRIDNPPPPFKYLGSTITTVSAYYVARLKLRINTRYLPLRWHKASGKPLQTTSEDQFGIKKQS
ncbi:unnamed protein product [Cuscuta campestris]|uniref:Reverse transcriptase domain-containing protein n=1 Tax=Cuscuta campestris TaxID=132261 RepID=A0A484LAL6_9ASTE|nr:unnamed protein product [Cuscuta campestris]